MNFFCFHIFHGNDGEFHLEEYSGEEEEVNNYQTFCHLCTAYVEGLFEY